MSRRVAPALLIVAVGASLALAFIVRAQDSRNTGRATKAPGVALKAELVWPVDACRELLSNTELLQLVPTAWNSSTTLPVQLVPATYASSGCHLAVRDFLFPMPPNTQFPGPGNVGRVEATDAGPPLSTQAECESYRGEAYLYRQPMGVWALPPLQLVAGGRTSGTWMASPSQSGAAVHYCERHKTSGYVGDIAASRGGQEFVFGHYRLVAGARTALGWRPLKIRAIWSSNGDLPNLLPSQL